jgi:hypothetical protein
MDACRPKWITKARLQRCEALDQQYGKEEQVQRTNILRMLLKHHRGEYTQVRPGRQHAAAAWPSPVLLAGQ